MITLAINNYCICLLALFPLTYCSIIIHVHVVFAVIATLFATQFNFDYVYAITTGPTCFNFALLNFSCSAISVLLFFAVYNLYAL